MKPTKLCLYGDEMKILSDLQKQNPDESLTQLLNRIVREHSQREENTKCKKATKK
jgi:hypothetical protein